MSDIMISVTNGLLKYLLAASAVAVMLPVLAWLIIKAVKIKAPIYRHMVWLYVLIGIVALPAIWSFSPKLILAVLPATNHTTEVAAQYADLHKTTEFPEKNTDISQSPLLVTPEILQKEGQTTSMAFPAKSILAGLWLIGVVFMLARLSMGCMRLRKIIKRAKPMPQNIHLLNINERKLKMLLTSEFDSPVCFGIARPIIILPEVIYNNNSVEELRMILNHELAHIERRDCWTNLFQRIIEAVLFFHPLIWYASSQLTQQREQICDNYVLAEGASATNYVGLLSRIVEQGFAANRLQAVALFEGKLLLRVRSLLDPKRNYQTKASSWAKIAGAIAILICLTFGTFKLEAKAEKNISENVKESKTLPIDPNIKAFGEAVKKRITTYTDESVFTLKDNESVRMPVKENIAGAKEIELTPHIVTEGTKFDIKVLDANENAMGTGEMQTIIIHDGTSSRQGPSVNVNGVVILCKIQLTPNREDSNSVTVEVKALFTPLPTSEETKAMLLTRGKEGQLMLNFQAIGILIAQYKERTGDYPKDLKELGQQLPKDVYSPAGEDYHYELNQTGVILSSCGKDGVYCNDDDEFYIYNKSNNTTLSGQRHELYPWPKEMLGRSSRRPTGNCSISGKVISAEDGKPVDKAQVYLFCVATHDPIFINPEADGSFEFKNIPSGQYSLSVIRASGFQNQEYNPEQGSGSFPWFTIKDGEQRNGIVFELKPSYTISGKVLDENGQPYSNKSSVVRVHHQSTKDGGPGGLYSPNGHPSQIGADGSYLIEALDGSPVYVMVYDWDSRINNDCYPPCYYPGTVSRNEAKLVTFDATKSVTNIDIRLTKVGPCVIEGSVTDSNGNPVPKAWVVVHHPEMLFDSVSTYTDEQGKYQINGIGPGDYLVHVDAEPFGYVRSRQPVTIESGVKKVDFILNTGVTINGQIVDESGNLIDVGPNALGGAEIEGVLDGNNSYSWTNDFSKFHKENGRLATRPFSAGQGDYHSSVMDFPTPQTFVIQGMSSGKTKLWFDPKNLEFKVKKIVYNDQNIMNTGIETEPGQQINDVTVVVGKP